MYGPDILEPDESTALHVGSHKHVSVSLYYTDRAAQGLYLDIRTVQGLGIRLRNLEVSVLFPNQRSTSVFPFPHLYLRKSNSGLTKKKRKGERKAFSLVFEWTAGAVIKKEAC